MGIPLFRPSRLLSAAVPATMILLLTGCNVSPFAKSTNSKPTVAAVLVRTPGAQLARLTTNKPKNSASKPRGHVVTNADIAGRRSYARHILPILKQSAPVFDRAVALVGPASMDQLASRCGQYSGQVGLLQQRIDGVPHPFLWWKPGGHLHHRVFGVYHSMLGAINACQTATDSTDATLVSQAKADMATAATQMHKLIYSVQFIGYRS